MRRGISRLGAVLLATSALFGAVLSGSAFLGEARAEAANDFNFDAADIIVKGQVATGAEDAYSATRLEQAEIRQAALSKVEDLFRFVPGMSVRELGLPGVASNIVIRGFGNGGHGGDLGAVIDGVPLNEAMSHADGYVDFNVIVPLETEAMTVFRGPVSALYGNYNRAGLVNIQTRKSGDYSELDASGGSFGTGDLQLALGTPLGERQQINLAAQIYRTQGFRDQSEADRQTVAGRWAVDVTPSLHLALSTRLHYADAQGAGYVTQAQFSNDPYGIDPRTQNDGARKSFASHRVDVNADLSATTTLLGFAYMTRQDFTRWFTRPVGGGVWRQREEDYDRAVLGAGASLQGTAGPVRYTVGLEGFRERTDYQYHDGLDRRVRQAEALADRRTRLNSLSAFTELNVPLHRLADASLGLRADRFTGGCRPQGHEAGEDPCGALRSVSEFSPKFGLRSEVAPWLQLRASWAEGFALPNSFVKYALGGQDLSANIFRQSEVGFEMTLHPSAKLNVAAFRLNSSNEVRTVAPGIYENFGKTRREGLEATLEVRPADSLWLRAVYGRTRTEVRASAEAALIGHPVPGVPRDTATVDAVWSPLENWSLEASWRLVGRYAVDALNTLRSDSYRTLDLGLSYRSVWPVPLRVYLRADNITDATYATSVSVIGGETLLAPGAPRAVRAGVQLTL